MRQMSEKTPAGGESVSGDEWPAGGESVSGDERPAGGESVSGGESPAVRLVFLRHGETEGNLAGRYVGRTDEPLSAEGRRTIRRLRSLPCLLRGRLTVYVSPMRRCQETAALLLEGLPAETLAGCQTVPAFAECDFGAFEYHNYRELTEDRELAPLYQAWIDSGGTLPFPDGEAPAAFRRRCVRAFQTAMEKADRRTDAAAEKTASEENVLPVLSVEDTPEADCRVFVVHGGTIMSILEAFGEPKRGYYDYQVPCGGGFSANYRTEQGIITGIQRLRPNPAAGEA